MLSRARFAALAAGCAVAPAIGRAQGLTPLHVGSSPDEDIVACLYAQQSGIFRRLGLDVTTTPAASGSAVAAAVVGGSIDIGKSSLIGLISAHARGIPITLLAPAAEYNSSMPNTGTVVRNDSPLKTARDLSGKTVAVPSLRGQLQMATSNWVDLNGGDSSSVHFVELPASANLEALDTGRIDAATFSNPEFGNALASKRARLLCYSSDSIGKHYLEAAYFCTLDFARKNSDAVKNFARGIAEGARYGNTHRAQTVDMISKFTSVEPAVILSMARVEMGITLLPAEIQPSIDLAAKYKAIPARFDARELIYGSGA